MAVNNRHKFLKVFPTDPGRWRVLDFDYKSSFVVVAKLYNGQIILESMSGVAFSDDFFKEKDHKVLFMKE